MLNLPTDKDNETAEDILIYLDLLRVTDHSDHIQRHTVVADPQDDKDSLIAEVATIVQQHTAPLRAEVEALRARVGWYRCSQTLPPFNVRVRLWARFLEDGKLSKGEESHGTRIAVFKSEAWAREWIWDTPDGTTDESEDYGRRYTYWQYITPPEGEEE